jgi:hypothetical protein
MPPLFLCSADLSWDILGVFFSKDHREEIIEVEEEPELVYLPGSADQVKLMTQGEWMKGCPPPSGGEQSFLFGLYSQLSEGKCVCPHECGSSVLRKKSDFFPIFVSRPSFNDASSLIILRCAARVFVVYYTFAKRRAKDLPALPLRVLLCLWGANN